VIDLRPYQDMAVEELRRLIRQGWRRLLLQADGGTYPGSLQGHPP
jgi:superfamily II DNA or RNA helicase